MGGKKLEEILYLRKKRNLNHKSNKFSHEKGLIAFKSD